MFGYTCDGHHSHEKNRMNSRPHGGVGLTILGGFVTADNDSMPCPLKTALFGETLGANAP
jgi:hypothetical protein